MKALLLGFLATLIPTSAKGGVRSSECVAGDAALREGLDLQTAGRPAEALSHFQQAHELCPEPRALAQVGLAETALGRWPDAKTHLAASLSSSEDPWIHKNRVQLGRALADVESHLPPPVAGRPHGRNTRRLLAGIGLGLAGAVLAGAITANVAWHRDVETWNQDCGLARDLDCPGLADHRELTRHLAIAGYAVAGALATASVIVLAASQKEASSPGTTRMTLGAGPGQFGIAFSQTF